jgi:hypothetical protein
MPNTTKGISYPSPSDSVDIAGDIQVLAETVETSLNTFNYNMTAAGDILTRSASATAPQPVGTNGAILVADSTTSTGLRYSSTLKGYPAMIPILSQSVTGVSATISSIPQTYDDLLVRLKLRSSPTADELVLTWSNATASQYYRVGWTQRSNGAYTANGNGGVSLTTIQTSTNGAGVQDGSNNYGYSVWELLVMDYSASGIAKNWVGLYSGRDGNNPNSGSLGGGNTGTGAITSFTIATASGTDSFVAGSTVELYGFKK